ncbi:MAG TPA: alpha/beta family hydrolase [Acidimicrobiales bacterium]|nr:alpha/beta family hydrolase [Acidimicrobiales bacterium]
MSATRRRPAPPAALLLTPGASADRTQAALVAIDEAAAALGFVVERIDLPRRRADALVDVVTDAAAALAERAGVDLSSVFLGGRSLGGRVCSMAVAAGLPAAGLVLVSYPLHPPGRPDQPRTAHLPRIGVPCLFVSGTRDAFATPAELEAATATIPGPVTRVWVEGGDHGLRHKDAEVARAVAEWLGNVRLGR